MSPFSTNRPRNDHHGVDLISDALPFGGLWYDGPNAASNAIGYASQYSRSHDAVIRVYDAASLIVQEISPRSYVLPQARNTPFPRKPSL